MDEKLRYIEVCLSPYEVPGESTICIYISGCRNGCKECQSVELQDPAYGDILKHSFSDIIEAYKKQASCVAFMGEGFDTINTRLELVTYSLIAQGKGLKTCLYSGRDISLEPWMDCFDYVKIGSYQKEYGPLTSSTTNQRFYVKKAGEHIDMTSLFWGSDDDEAKRQLIRGLRTKENIEFIRFYWLVQKEAEKLDSVFFLESGDGKAQRTENLECEDLWGWLIPTDQADTFEKLYMDFDKAVEGYIDYFRYVDYKVLSEDEVSIEFVNWDNKDI